MDSRKLLTVAAALVCVFAFSFCFAGSDSSDAAEPVVKGGEPTWSSFDDASNGHFYVYVKNNSGAPITVTVCVYDASDSDMLDSTTESVPADGEVHKISTSFKFSSNGTKSVKYAVCNEDGSHIYFEEGSFDISVSHSMWKNVGTYVLIVIVVIAIILIAFFLMRSRAKKRLDSAPKKTFTELEAERKAKKAGKTAEKKMYNADESKKKRE